MKYVMLTSDSPQKDWFWAKMGRFFADPTIRKALGIAMSDSLAHIWVLAIEGETVAGFAALVRQDSAKPRRAKLVHAYVRPEYRNQGVYKKLLEHRIKYADAHSIRFVATTCTDMSKPALEKAGFVAVGKRGRYTNMELHL